MLALQRHVARERALLRELRAARQGRRLPRTSAAAPTQSSAPPATAAGSASGTPTPLASPSPTPSPSTAPAVLDLGDVVLVVPDGWELYADELVQDSRRLVRVREPLSDTRVQAVTLTTVGDDLAQACRDLVTDQQQAFTGVAESVVVDVPMTGAAVACPAPSQGRARTTVSRRRWSSH